MKAEVNNSQTWTGWKAVQEKYSSGNKEVRTSIKKDKNSYLEGLANWAEMTTANGHMKVVHQTQILS